MKDTIHPDRADNDLSHLTSYYLGPEEESLSKAASLEELLNALELTAAELEAMCRETTTE